MISRRSILTGLIAAPIIVKASSLMKISTALAAPAPVRFPYNVPFVTGQTVALCYGNERRYFLCTRTGMGNAAEFVEELR